MKFQKVRNIAEKFYIVLEVKSLSHVQLFATPWTVPYQAPPSMEFSRQEYWSGLPFPSPGDLPNPGIKLGSPALQTDALLSEPPGKPHKIHIDAIKMNEADSFTSRNLQMKKKGANTSLVMISKWRNREGRILTQI